MAIDLSIVTTLYFSESFIPEFLKQASRAALALSPDYEIILVNDGSPDASLSVILTHQAQDARVIVIDLSRNFGHHQALRAGLSFARGENIFLIDSDLEEKPAWLADFNRLLKEKECDAVYGVQRARKLCRGIPLMGWPSLIVSLWFLGGMIIFFVGLLGIYLANVFVEMKRRPSTIVKAVYRSAEIAAA
jgi:cellulose synthase/poly-beta-1,6-N-acetylglucosamine synthase-like glycosyltransferase